MSIAERAYNSTTRGNRAKESDEDRLYRLATMHNKILRMIEQVNDARTFLQCRNAINAYANEVGKNSLDVAKLNGKLTERIKSVAQDTQKTIEKISAEIEAVKNDKFIESAEVLQELNVQSEHRLLQFMMQLGANNGGNTGSRRRVGNWVKDATRADALALIKLASFPQFAECFSNKQKQIILEKSKNPAEVIFEKNKEPVLAEKGQELGKFYMKSFNLRNVMKKISNEESAYYFDDNEEE